MKIRAFLAGVVVLFVFAILGAIALCPTIRATPTIPRPPMAPERRRTLNAVAFLDAIAAVETGNRWAVIGEHGERGRCQILRTTWYRYTTAGFEAWASSPNPLGRRVERAHLNHLLRVLFPVGSDPDPALLAAAWRYGEHHAEKMTRSDYARRVCNLYSEVVAQ